VKKNIIFFFIFFGCFSWGNAQNKKFSLTKQLSVEVLEATINPNDTTIEIHYDLIGSKKRYFNTTLYYSNNLGNSYKGPLRSVSGDIGDSSKVGKDKIAAWKFKKDNPYFNGKNIKFKILAEEIPKIANGGPANAFLSMIAPGWGDSKVRNGYNYGFISGLTYGLAGVGGLYYLRADKKYDDYTHRVANTEAEHSNLLKQARKAEKTANVFFIAAGTVWLADVVGVYLRGVKNKQRLQKEAQKAETEETTYFLPKPHKFNPVPSIVPTFDGHTNITNFTLVWKF
jgi:hypothetical protein